MNVLAISAHPDDETLGCGGSLLKHRAAGDHVFWLIATEAHEPQWTKADITRKASEVERVAKAYGMDRYVKLGFPTVRLDTLPQTELIERVRGVIAEVKPEVVYVVHGGDGHSDHRAVFTATMAVLKPWALASYGVRRVLCHEVLSSTEAAPPFQGSAFIPQVYSDITPHMDRKIDIMNLFESERQSYPLPRASESIRALARYRGATIGAEYAEAFMLMREIG